MAKRLPEDAQERDPQRVIILPLAGFSFTAVAALAVLDVSSRPGLQLSVWYGLVSFIAYLGSFNLQSYKVSRWQNQLATGLIEVGSLSLLLTLISLLFHAKFEPMFQWIACVIGLAAWSIDHAIKLWIDHQYFRAVDAKLRKGELK